MLRAVCILLLLLPNVLIAQWLPPGHAQANVTSFSELGIAQDRTELLRHSNSEDLVHPEFGLRPFNAQCDSCIEIIHRRTEDSRYFVKEGTDGSGFFVQQAYGALHYQKDRRWTTIDHRLSPTSEIGRFAAPDQPLPTTIDIEQGYSSIAFPEGAFRFNQITGWYTGSPTLRKQLQNGPAHSHYEVGDDGALIQNAWPNADFLVLAKRGGFKSQVILHRPPAGALQEWFFVEDKVTLPPSFKLHPDTEHGYTTSEGFFRGDLLLLDSSGNERGRINSPVVYDQSPEAEQADDLISAYQFEQISNTEWLVRLVVRSSWLSDPNRQYPVVLDPLVTGTAAYNAGTIGFEPGVVCFDPSVFCSYNLTVTIPGQSTLTAAVFSAEYNSLGSGCSGLGCNLNEAGFRIYGPCSNTRSPAGNGYYTSSVAQPGTRTFNGINIFTNVNCNTTSCAPHNLDFEMRTYHCSCTGGSCGTSCHNMTAGSWSITVEGRTLETTINITTVKDTICPGETITLQSFPTYGVPPYTYQWDHLNLTTQNIGFIPLSSSTYHVTVTDSCGNSRVDSVYVHVWPEPQLTFPQVTPSCSGQNAGSATVNTSTPAPYTYTWSTNPTQTTQQATNLGPGWYHVTVTDGHGCPTSDSVEIPVPPGSLTFSTSKTDISCFGANDGQAQVTPNNGSPPYTITWNTNPVQTTSQITGLGPGQYTVTVTDDVGCEVVETVSIIEPGQLTVQVTTDSVTCVGAGDGTATANVSGGTGPFSYAWNTNPQQTTQQATNLSSGTYRVTVTDTNGCSATTTGTIGSPNPLTVQVTATNATCGGQNDGTATANPSGGTPPYTYRWNSNPQQITQTATLLPGGIYTVTVTDSRGCTATATGVVNQPGNMNLTVVKQDVTCYGLTDGQATVSVQGGIGPFTYDWTTNPPQNTRQATNLAAGTYTILVTDSFGCTASTQLTIDEPDRIIPQIDVTPISCPGGSDGGLQVISTSGGNPPYNHEWQTTPPTPGPTLTNLSSGDYVLRVTDVSQCTIYDTTFLPNPAPMVISFTTVNATCEGRQDGQIIANVTDGAAPYTYDWSVSGNNSNQRSNLDPGKYYLTVTDDNGCTRIDSVVLGSDIIIAIDTTITRPSCPGIADGAIQITASGGAAPYQYLWADSTTGAVRTNITSGIYAVTVTDANGCMGSPAIDLTPVFNLTVDAGLNQTINSGESVTLIAIATPPGSYTYSWSPATGLDNPDIPNPTATPQSETLYTVTVSDAAGCNTSDTVRIMVRPSERITIPNAFSPNGDGNNDYFFAVPNVQLVRLEIYNRWGNQVYNDSQPWDGTSDGVPQPVGVYVYRAIVEYPDSKIQVPRHGNVTLLR